MARFCPFIVFLFTLILPWQTALAAEGLVDDPLPTVRQILDRFYESAGGRAMHEQLVSFRATGKILRGDQEETFTVFRKRPDRFRISQKRRDVTTILGFEGRDGWRIIVRDGEVIFSERMQDEDTEALVVEVEFNGPLLTTHNLSRDLRTIGRQPLDEETQAIVLEGRISAIDRTSRIAVDEETGMEVWWELIGEDETRRTDFSDYRIIEGFPFAHRMVISSNGDVDSIILIDRIDVNMGIFDSFFRLDFALDSIPHAADAQINR